MNILYTFIFFIFLNFTNIFCVPPVQTIYKFYDLTESSSKIKYVNPPLYSYCDVNIQILVVNNFDLNGVVEDSIINNAKPIIGNIGEVIYKNQTSAIFKGTFNQFVGSQSFNISTSDFSKGYIELFYECIDINVTSLSAKSIGKTFYSQTTGYATIVKFNEFKYDIQLPYLINGGTTTITIEQLSRNYYIFLFSILEYNNRLLNSNSDIQIIFNNEKNFTFQILFDNVNNFDDKLFDIRTYPNDISNVFYQRLGFVSEGIISFTSSSTIQNPVYLLLLNNIQTPIIPRPISGKKNNITYITSTFPTFAYDSPNSSLSYSLYSTNEQSLLKNQLNFTSNSFQPFGLKNGIATGGMTYMVTDSITSTVSMVNCILPNNLNYTYKYFRYYFNGLETFIQLPFPWGFVSGNNLNYTLGISFEMPNFYNSMYSFGIKDLVSNTYQTISIDNNQIADSNGPVLTFFESYYIGEFNYLLRLGIDSDTPVQRLTFSSTTIFRNSLVKGNLTNGVWEILWNGVKTRSNNLLFLINYDGSSSFIEQGTHFSVLDPNQVLNLPVHSFDDFNYFENIKNISFLFNNIDITNQTVANKMFISFYNYPENVNEIDIALQLLDPKTLNNNLMDIETTQTIQTIYSTTKTPIYTDNYFSKWDANLNCFEIKFFVPANTIPGNLSYQLIFGQKERIFSSSLPNEFQLNLISNNIDIRGPIFSNIIKKINSNSFGWLLTIEDDINGFRNGFITVIGSIDNSVYNFSITSDMISGGNKWKGDYEILIKGIDYSRCISQDYIIVRVVLFDSFSNVAKFSVFPVSPQEEPILSLDSSSSPFIYFLNDSTINRISFISSTEKLENVQLPELILFNVSKPSVDVNSLDRTVLINFEVTNPISGIKQDVHPIVYLSNLDHLVIQCISTIESITFTNGVYSCSIEIPVGFGMGDIILLSVYGFINNAGYYSGFTTQAIKDKNMDWFIDTKHFNLEQPIITGTSSISNVGGDDLYIYGIGFSSPAADSLFINIKNKQINLSKSPSISFSSLILIPNFPAINDSFTITVTINGLTSNEFVVQPIKYFFNYTAPTYPIPTSSPIPTNPPQKCLGNPVCGGINQGFCNGDAGCICYPPWIGLTCTSQVIVVPQPPINTTKPSTEIPTNSMNSEDSTDSIFFKSLISIVSLRELDFNRNQIKSFTFEKWIYSPLNKNTSLYETSITTTNSERQSITTNITATLEWFSDSKTIVFANQQLQMNPSSIKYTIKIESYPFSSSLNQLQLVMSSSLQSSKSNEICSSKQFGNTTSGDDSNFMVNQVGDHSIYGRFIKRGIIDSVVKSIQNIPLDSSMNVLSESRVSQTYIGITIPCYRDNIIIDPDFSILVDSKAADKDSENSICSTNDNSGLSKTQIIGIAIGSFGVVAVATFCIIYYAYKRHIELRFLKDFTNKLKNLGNDNNNKV